MVPKLNINAVHLSPLIEWSNETWPLLALDPIFDFKKEK